VASAKSGKTGAVLEKSICGAFLPLKLWPPLASAKSGKTGTVLEKNKLGAFLPTRNHGAEWQAPKAGKLAWF